MSNNTPPNASADDSIDWEAVARLLTGESSAQEAASLRGRIDANPAELAAVSAMSDVVASVTVKDANPADRPIDVEGALARVHAKMAVESNATVRSIHGAPKTSRKSVTAAPVRSYWRVAGLAAAAMALVAIGVRGWFSPGTTAVEQVATTYSTAVGAHDSINLPDGSTVVLAPGSRLVVDAAFKSGNRNVTLEGAAYFHVVHDEKRPFAVHAGSAVVRDIGTAFSVKTVAGSAVYVAVREGAVALADTLAKATQPVELRAGDRGMARATDGVTAQRGTARPDDPSWNSDVLSFRDASWSEVETDLKRWYGVQLVVADTSIQGRTVTHTTTMNDSATTVIKVIASMFGSEVQVRGDTTFLVKPRSKLRP